MKPLINGGLRAWSQLTANPVAVPIKAPAITSVEKWYPASTRSTATLPPIAKTPAPEPGRSAVARGDRLRLDGKGGENRGGVAGVERPVVCGGAGRIGVDPRDGALEGVFGRRDDRSGDHHPHRRGAQRIGKVAVIANRSAIEGVHLRRIAGASWLDQLGREGVGHRDGQVAAPVTVPSTQGESGKMDLESVTAELASAGGGSRPARSIGCATAGEAAATRKRRGKRVIAGAIMPTGSATWEPQPLGRGSRLPGVRPCAFSSVARALPKQIGYSAGS